MRTLLLTVLILAASACARFDGAVAKPVSTLHDLTAKVKPVLVYCPFLPAEAQPACFDAAEAVRRAEAVADALSPAADADAGK